MGTNAAEKVMAWMSSLADPTRLRLMHLLADHELGVAELCEVLQLPQSTVSRHLKVLADRGWVRCRHRGTANLYRAWRDELEEGAARLWTLALDQADGWPTFEQDDLRLTEILARRKASSFFAGAAPRWQSLRVEQYGAGFPAAALAALVPRDAAVVDLGCGDGEMAALLGHTVARVVGVDSSEEMLAAADAQTAGMASVELVHGDLEDLPLSDGQFDAALMILALTYLERPEVALAELVRVLVPGGRAVVVTLLRHDREDFRLEMGQVWPGFERDDLDRLLVDAGLEGVHVRPLPPEQEAKGPALCMATGSKPVEGASPPP